MGRHSSNGEGGTRIAQAEFRTVAGNFATGVTVITIRDENGPKGFTANAVTSLSLDPPSILVCVDKSSDTYPALQEEGAMFVVNILAESKRRFREGSLPKERISSRGWDTMRIPRERRS